MVKLIEEIFHGIGSDNTLEKLKRDQRKPMANKLSSLVRMKNLTNHIVRIGKFEMKSSLIDSQLMTFNQTL